MYSSPLFMQAPKNPNTPAKQTGGGEQNTHCDVNMYIYKLTQLNASQLQN